MPLPIEEMAAQVAELRQDIDFVVLAGQLRPRLGGVVNWEAQADVRAKIHESQIESTRGRSWSPSDSAIGNL